MQQYQNLLKTILEEGSWNEGRNGKTLGIFGHSMTFYMKDGFPVPTVKQTYWKTAIKEMLGFLSGFDDAASFRGLGVGVWDQNANTTPEWLRNDFRKGLDDLGPIYGVQWRSWKDIQLLPGTEQVYNPVAIGLRKAGYTRLGVTGTGVGVYTKIHDQVKDCLTQLLENPTSRRILFHGWNVGDLDKMALPPCHLLYQFGADVDRNRLSLNVYIRSNDVGLGAPFNITASAFLLHLFARLTGFEAYKLTYMIGDAHLYENQVDMAKEMLSREPFKLPEIKLSNNIPNLREDKDKLLSGEDWLTNWSIDDVELIGYQYHPAIKVDMIA